MNEVVKRDEYLTTSKLSRLGVSAVGYSAAGIFLFILKGAGFIIGGAACLIGVGSLFSKDPTDRKAGAVIIAAGALAILSKLHVPLLTGVSGVLLTIGAVGLLALGVWNGIKFFLGLKKRS